MTSTFLSTTYGMRLSRSFLCVALGYACFLGYQIFSMPGTSPATRNVPAPGSWPGIQAVGAGYIAVFEMPDAGTQRIKKDSDLSKRYRYAGAFVSLSAGDTRRTAVIDDTEQGQEHLVHEGETLNGMTLAGIQREYIELQVKGVTERLYRRGLNENHSPSSETRAASPVSAGPVALAPNRKFGNRVGRNHWVLSREKLMDYYQEVMADPERLVNVFDSMEPRYQPDGSINGYKLNRQGEDEFFDGVGLAQGDAIHKVNNVHMSNRGRAEAFLRSFANNHVSILLIDIERNDGTTERVRYDFR